MGLKNKLLAGVTAFSLVLASGSAAMADKAIESDGDDTSAVVIIALAALILFGTVGQPAVPPAE